MKDARREDMPTSSSLLLRIRDNADHRSWQSFFDTYNSLIYGVAIREGLNHAEAQEVVQETMARLSETMASFSYNRSKGSFRSWLLRLVYWKIGDQFRRRCTNDIDLDGNQPEFIDTIPDSRNELATRIDQAWIQSMISMATASVKEKVSPIDYQIYDQYVLQERSAEDVVRDLGVSKSKVYITKLRVGKVFATEILAIQKKLESGCQY